MFCLFVRFPPMVATAEVKTVLPQANPHGHAGAEREIMDHRTALDPQACDARGSLPMPLLPNQLPKGPTMGSSPSSRRRRTSITRASGADAGFTRWDAHTPFPVHGLEAAMGLRRPPTPGSSSSRV